jgi:hypothetical protein
MAVHRNRVIYQSEALFISPDSTGYHFTGAHGAVTDSAGTTHNAHWGLMTPPKDLFQVHGKKQDGGGNWISAKNGKGQSVGWQCGDKWPEWNPEGNGGAKASFSADVDMDNLTVDYRLEADVVGVAGNVPLVGDGSSTVSDLIAAAVLADPAIGGISVNPIAEVKSSVSANSVTYSATATGTDGDGIVVTFVPGATSDPLVITEDAVAKTINIAHDPVAINSDLSAAWLANVTLLTIAIAVGKESDVLVGGAVAATANGVNADSGGDLTKVLDGSAAPGGVETIVMGSTVVGEDPVAAIAADASHNGVTIEAIAPGAAGNAIAVTFTSVPGQATIQVVEDAALKTISVTFDANKTGPNFHDNPGLNTAWPNANPQLATLTVNSASSGINLVAGTFNLGAAGGGTDGADAIAGAKATANYTAKVESKLAGVEIVADLEGSHGNVTLTGTDIDDVDELVRVYNAGKNPNHTALTVVSGGGNFPNAGVEIKLAGGKDWFAKSHGSIIKQLKRVQSANYGFTVARQDVNQFGHASRLDAIVVESPTVNLDFSYYLLEGYNERMLEFVTDGQTNALSGLLTPELYQAGNNFFILTAPEARDAVVGDIALHNEKKEDHKSVIALGNGYITDYSVDISVGSIPTASVTVEGMNIRSDYGTTGNDIPAVNMKNGARASDAWKKDGNGDRICNEDGCTGLYSLPPANSGYTGCNTDGSDGSIAALRPGDVLVDLDSRSLISKSVAGNSDTPVIGSSHVQSASISLPLGRTTLQRLGSVFGFSKAIDLPLSVSMSFNAIVADLKEGNMLDLLCDCEEFDVGVTIFKPECAGCTVKDINDGSKVALRYTMKGARLESETFSSTIGDNKSVDLTFTTQIGSSDDMRNGLYIEGSEDANAADIKGVPPAWTGVDGSTIDPIDGYLFGYRK